MILSTECFTANITRIGAFVCVCAFVNEKVVGFGEMTITVFANELFLWTRAESSGGFDGRM